MNTPTPEPMPEENKYWWSDDEETYQGPFDTKEGAYSDAYCYRADCFDDPSQNSSLFILYGHKVVNPDYDPDWPICSDNFQFHITGKPECVDAITITDYFHTEWVKLAKEADLSRPAVGDAERTAAIDAFKQHHRNSCYPEATYFEAEQAITDIIAALHLSSPQPPAEDLLALKKEPVDGIDVSNHDDHNEQGFIEGWNAGIDAVLKKLGA